MGDFIDFANRINLSPINTILLLLLYFVLKGIFTRLSALETVVTRNGRSIWFIKGRLALEEDDDTYN